MAEVDLAYVVRFGFANAIAGSIAGLSAAIVGQPLDTMKTRLQTYTGARNSLWVHMQELFRIGGIRAFYRGSFSPVLTKALACGTCFSVVASTKKYLGSYGMDTTSPMAPACLIAYCLSGLVESSFITPIESFKVKLQTAAPGTVTVSSILENAKLRDHFRGWSSCFGREALGNLAFFGAYFTSKDFLIKNEFIEQEKMRTCLAGGCAGVWYWIIIYPLDACKSIIQAQSPKDPNPYRGLLDCAKRTYMKHGLRRFYQGMFPCLIRSAPVSMSIFLVYEEALPVFSKLFAV